MVLGRATPTGNSETARSVRSEDRSWLTGASAVVDIAAGGHHACLVDRANRVACWGNNEWAQLGDAGTDDSPTPMRVDSPLGAVSVAAGDWHSCAVTIERRLACWGNNEYEQIAADGEAIESEPHLISGLYDVIQVAADGYRTCARASPSGLACWGRNDYGEVGDGSAGDPISSPTDVIDVPGGTALISAGQEHSCLVAERAIYCWGRNDSGQLGVGNTVNQLAPTRVRAPE